MTKRRAVFLDRDGVLNKAVHAGGKSFPPADAEALELVPGARDAVARLRAAGYVCICVTNQPDVARGTRTRENVDEMNRKVLTELELDDLYVCPHDSADGCPCRKPKPGMLLAAAEKWGICLAESWMVGDRRTDVAAGRAAGCRTVLVAPDGSDAAGADQVCRDAALAAEHILGADGAPRRREEDSSREFL